jgi:hypothetical protein
MGIDEMGPVSLQDAKTGVNRRIGALRGGDADRGRRRRADVGQGRRQVVQIVDHAGHLAIDRRVGLPPIRGAAHVRIECLSLADARERITKTGPRPLAGVEHR